MRQLILRNRVENEKRVILKGKDYHYLVHVLRVSENSTLSIRDKTGTRYLGRIAEITKSSCLIDLEEKECLNQEIVELTLYQCIPKGRKLDTIVRQATETGVKRIIPVISRYSIPQNQEDKAERYNRIIKEAQQQSGSSIQTEILPSIKFSQISPITKEEEIGLFLHSAPLEKKTLHEYLSSYKKGVSVVVGPEGGLSQEETDNLIQKGYLPVFFQQNILRSETAAIYGIAAIQIVISEKHSWRFHATQG